MWSIIKDNPKAVIFAVLVHVIFAGVLIFSFSRTTPTVAVNPEVNIVKATVIDEGKIKKEQARKETIRRKKEQERKEAERKKREAKKKAEAKRQAELKKKRELQEKKQLALKKKKEAEAKKQKQQEAEKKKKREAAELKKKQDEAETARKAQEEDLKRQLAEDERQRQQRAQNEIRRAAQQKEVDKFKAQIKQAISNKWRIPVSAQQGQECVLKLRLIPSGDVVGVEVLKSSGDSVFDRSVEAAVYKAQPLPLPPAESGLFNEFREINVPFRLEKKI